MHRPSARAYPTDRGLVLLDETGRLIAMIDTASAAASLLSNVPTVGSPTLIIAGPALALVRQWETELAVLHRRSPSSDAATTLTTCLRELVEAIKAGRDTRLHLTIADLHQTSGIPVSTLRWLCKHKSDLIGAQKHEGVWYVDRAKFDRYMSESDREVPLGAPPASSIADVVEAA